MELYSYLIIFLAIIFSATFIRSSIGFGDALISMPLLILLSGLKTATPISAMLSATIALLILTTTWKEIQFKSVWKLIVASAVGIPIGLFFLKGSYDDIMKIILGILIIIFSIFKLLEPKLIQIRNTKSAYIFGFLGGIFGGAFNTSGPFIVVYATLRNWSPSKFRTTLQGYFLASNIIILTMHGASGLWTKQVFILYLTALPVIIVTTLIGGKLNHIIPKGKFDKLIFCFLLIIGVLLIFQTTYVYF